jgi:formylglycine-generating enzyme required for sulfatase activity
LFLPTVRTPGAGLSVHLVTGTWNESARLADVPSIVAGSIGMIAAGKMASRRFVTVDVKDTVQKWINGGTLNEGFAIQPIVKAGSPTASVMLTSKEGPVFGLPAELDIEFQPANNTSLTTNQLAVLSSIYAPKITKEPVDTDHLGQFMRVEAEGLPSLGLTFQWMRNGEAISGATDPELSVKNLQSGTYTVVVTNNFSSVSSRSVQFNNPIGTFALVSGGTLPASSQLEAGARAVDTFYIGRTEVTWGEWETVYKYAIENGYDFVIMESFWQSFWHWTDHSYPANTDWYDAVKWCNARSEKEGRTPVYMVNGAVYKTGQATPVEIASANGYRLPSEAEWEFAARGGTQTRGYIYSGSNTLDDVGWHFRSGGAAQKVGKLRANELGIYDMSGNLMEWTGSWYPGSGGSSRALRGGNFMSSEEPCAVAFRYDADPSNGGWQTGDRGFRVATSGEYAFGITAQPTVSLDGTSMSVQAAGAGMLSYQWMHDGIAVSGGTGAQLSTQGLQAGTYTVVVRNGFVSKTSNGVEYSLSPIGRFALVSGGILPASSDLGGVQIATFYIGKTEVTWDEWEMVRTWAASKGYDIFPKTRGVSGLGNDYPVTNVSWFDAMKWCNARSEKEGRTPVYTVSDSVYRAGQSTPNVADSANGYRLPSEAEWEFAARGGTQTRGYIYSGSNVLNEVGWYGDGGGGGNAGGAKHQVAQKKPNELGIYDMSGNVREWAWDAKQGMNVSPDRAVRGGGWFYGAGGSTVAIRIFIQPGTGGEDLGFRVVLNAGR